MYKCILLISLNIIFYIIILFSVDCLHIGRKEGYYCGLKYNALESFVIIAMIKMRVYGFTMKIVGIIYRKEQS